MAGLKGQVRTPGQDVRVRRNSSRLADDVEFVSSSGMLRLDATGVITLYADADAFQEASNELQLLLQASGGLEASSGVGIKLQADPGLVLAASGLAAELKASGGLAKDADGIYIDLDATPGLALAAGGLSAKLKASGGLLVDANGLYVDESNVDHDSLDNYLGDEHIDWTNASDEFITSENVEIGSDNAFYLGDKTTDGTWRIIRDGNNLVMERREAGSWNAKDTITP